MAVVAAAATTPAAALGVTSPVAESRPRPNNGPTPPTMNGDSVPNLEADLEADRSPATATKEAPLNMKIAQNAQEGRLDLLKELVKCKNDGDSDQGDLPQVGGYVLLGACRGGQLKILEWLKAKRVDLSSHGGMMVRAAAGGGHLAVLEWLKENYIEPRKGGPAAVMRAAEGGHLHVLTWLHSDGIFEKLTQADMDVVYQGSAGNLEALQWLDKTNGRELTIKHGKMALVGAAGAGNVDSLRWLKDRNAGVRHDPEVLMAAATNNRLDALVWLDKHGWLSSESNARAVKEAKMLGHKDVANFLQNRPGARSSMFCFGLLFGKKPAGKDEPAAQNEVKATIDENANEDGPIENV